MGLAGVAAAVGVAGIAANAISASNQADAATQAADQQYKAAQLAAQTQRYMYNQTRSDLHPYLNIGSNATRELASFFGLNKDFFGNGSGGGGGGMGGADAQTSRRLQSALENYPGYQFQLNQGQQALDRSAASRGLLLSGAQLKDSQAFGQGVAQSSALQPFLGQLDNLASLGENAGAITGNAGSNASNGIASDLLAGGQAQAAGTVGAANALTSGLQGGLNSALLGYQLYNQNNNSAMPSTLDTGALNSTLNSGLSWDGSNYQYSDVRTKTDIERVGKTDDGLPIYIYRYKSGGPMQMGIMAQDVEKVIPDAVVTVNGLKMVDYGKLSSRKAA